MKFEAGRGWRVAASHESSEMHFTTPNKRDEFNMSKRPLPTSMAWTTASKQSCYICGSMMVLGYIWCMDTSADI